MATCSFENNVPSCSPIQGLLFTAKNLLSKAKTYRVFHHEDCVYKLYDKSESPKPNLEIKMFDYFCSGNVCDLYVV